MNAIALRYLNAAVSRMAANPGISLVLLAHYERAMALYVGKGWTFPPAYVPYASSESMHGISD